MHIVIIGGGKVGKELASALPAKGHSVVVVEKDPARAEELIKILDVVVINEDGANMATLHKAKIKQADIVIAVTQIDELNLMACMMAKKVNVPVTIARVRNPEGSDNIADTGFTQAEVGVDHVINPERTTALELAKLIHFPDAAEIEYFAKGSVIMLAVTVGQEFEITDHLLEQVPLPPGCIVVGIKRNDGTTIIPSGKDKIRAGNKVYLVGSGAVMRQASWLLHCEETIIRNVLILGGDTVGFNLASILEQSVEQGFKIKLIEKDSLRCEELNRKLNKTVVLKGDSKDVSFFNNEEFAEADVIVAVTGDDRTNLVAAVLGQRLGAKKIICEISDIAYSKAYDAIGIENYVNPHLLTASKILRFTRTQNVQAFSLLREESVEAFEVVVPESCRVSGKKIAEARFPRGMLIGAVVRNGKVSIPNGQTVLHPGDDLIVFTLTAISNKLERYFCSM